MTTLKIGATNTGKGVFALHDISKGTRVHTMDGAKLSTQVLQEAIKKKQIRVDDPFQIAEDIFLKLDRLSYYFNHSCEPNVGVNRRFELIALRDISMSEEISYDYSTTVCTHCEWYMRCLCGAPSCRKRIGNIRTIPKKRRAFFLQSTMLPLYIAKEITEVPKRRGALSP